MIKVVRGNPTPEELAAVVALLRAVHTAEPAPAPSRPRTWASPRLLLRTPQGYGAVGWRTSALPQ
ncbi:acyl-CoA carboxylase subunit epsilon [Streptomyces sp. LHD-70]|uniref:acyl-CoA carboxylase subunit epsilon n=1 Tax=Streptomyces sp. LHD-70 TaxID=3072140 RepID=UPI00280C6618|nr:acyl-CoA carboxylase subunit epsilon [Streptomyces sp. LHD-70]MDQ8707165.1 acyl-CoA carboxylase subunit epsilon [Streptomyces sp. LHD-70]